MPKRIIDLRTERPCLDIASFGRRGPEMKLRWADRFDSKDTGIVRRRHTNRADDQTLEYCRFGQSSLYRKRLQAQLELRIDSTLDAGTCGHAEHRLTSAALCLSCKSCEFTTECCIKWLLRGGGYRAGVRLRSANSSQ